MQIGESFRTTGATPGCGTTVIYGGVSQKPQEQALRRGGHPRRHAGRLLDLMGQKLVTSPPSRSSSWTRRTGCWTWLHRGHPPHHREASLGAADADVLRDDAVEIVRLSATLLRDPVRVQVAAASAPAEDVEHRLYYVEKASKADLLKTLLADD